MELEWKTASEKGGSALSLRWWARTDRGRVRANNEDSFMGLQFDSREWHHLGRLGEGSTASLDYAFAVSDGMGGELAGEFASRIVVEKTANLLPKLFQQKAAGLAAGFSDALIELFDRVHRALVYVGNSYEECTGMEATLSLCWLTPGWLYFGHLGDSRIYYLPAAGGGLKQLTHDHTHVGWLLRNGKINEREARNHPSRHALQRALGGRNQFVDPQVGAVGYEKGDRFLLCSDGLIDGLFDAQIAALLVEDPAGDPAWNPAERLVAAALEKSGRDNITAMVIEIF